MSARHVSSELELNRHFRSLSLTLRNFTLLYLHTPVPKCRGIPRSGTRIRNLLGYKLLERRVLLYAGGFALEAQNRLRSLEPLAPLDNVN